MYYLKNIETGFLVEMSHMPIKPEKFIELTKEEYEAAIAAIEEGE